MRNRINYQSYDNSVKRYMRHLLVLLALVMAQALLSLTVSAESKEMFFAKNMARCFYCDINTEITPSATLMPAPSPGQEPQADEIEQYRLQQLPSAKSEPEIPVVDSAPAPYKNMVKAYESGDLKSAYQYAEQWVRYQERLAKRTKDLSALMIKAQRMRQQSGVAPISSSLKINSKERYQVLYFFDLHSRTSERASKEIQSFYEQTLTDPRIELSSWALGNPSDSELTTYQEQLEFQVPLHRAAYLTEKFDISNGPTVLVLNQRGENICRHEDYIDSDTLLNFLNNCAENQAYRSNYGGGA